MCTDVEATRVQEQPAVLNIRVHLGHLITALQEEPVSLTSGGREREGRGRGGGREGGGKGRGKRRGREREGEGKGKGKGEGRGGGREEEGEGEGEKEHNTVSKVLWCVFMCTHVCVRSFTVCWPCEQL